MSSKLSESNTARKEARSRLRQSVADLRLQLRPSVVAGRAKSVAVEKTKAATTASAKTIVAHRGIITGSLVAAGFLLLSKPLSAARKRHPQKPQSTETDNEK